MGNEYKKVLWTIVISGGAFFLNCAINLVLPPYITGRVGAEAYGFVSLARNFVQYAAIITAALNSFAARHIAVEYHRSSRHAANVFFSSTFYGDIFLGTGLTAVLVGCTAVLEKLLHIPQQLVTDVKFLFLFTALNFFITTVFTVFGTSAFIKNRLDVISTFRTLSYAAEAAALLLLFASFRPRVFYVGIGLLVRSLVQIAGDTIVCKWNTPELRIRWKNCSSRAVKKLVTDGIWTSLSMVGETLHSGLDLLICDLLLTPLAMGQLAIAKTVHAIFANLFVLVGQAFQPVFLKSYAEGDIKSLRRELFFSMKISGMFSNVAYAGFAALGLTFYRLWIPGQDCQLVYRLSLIENLSVIASGTMFPLYYIYFLTVRKKLPTLITIASGFVNVIVMYIMIRYLNMGVEAVVWTTTVILSLINFVSNPLYMAYVLKLPLYTFYPGIGRNLLSLGAVMLVCRSFACLCRPGSWAGLASTAIVCALTGALLHLLVTLNRDERQMLMRYVRKKLHRYQKYGVNDNDE